MTQVVVITGLAQGMGAEVARQLASSGASVAGFDVETEQLGFAAVGFDRCEVLLDPEESRDGDRCGERQKNEQRSQHRNSTLRITQLPSMFPRRFVRLGR